MRKFSIAAACLAVPLLMGNHGGCSYADLPTMEQIELHIPASLRTCPYAPRSPGRNASKEQTARYILGLYNAWEVCHGTVRQRDALYEKWKRAVAAKRQGR